LYFKLSCWYERPWLTYVFHDVAKFVYYILVKNDAHKNYIIVIFIIKI